MPRYFFHVRDGQDYLDPDGTELKDLAAAQIYSLQVVTQILSTPGSEFWNGEDDVAGRLRLERLCQLTFDSAGKGVIGRHWTIELRRKVDQAPAVSSANGRHAPTGCRTQMRALDAVGSGQAALPVRH